MSASGPSGPLVFLEGEVTSSYCQGPANVDITRLHGIAYVIKINLAAE